MKTFKYFKYMAFSLLLAASLASCNDDETAEAPRLFRPVATLSSSANNIQVEWNHVKGATSYEVKLFQVIKEEGNILTLGEAIRTENANSSPFTFESVEWDEKYVVRIKAQGNNIESEYYTAASLLVNKPTSLNSVDRIIDNAAIITWKETEVPYTALVATPTAKKAEDGTVIEGAQLGDPIVYTITDEERVAGEKTIEGLEPLTTYKVAAYTGSTQEVSTYQGRTSFSTKASVNYDEKYGAGNYLDIRNLPDEEAHTIITKAYINELDASIRYLILKGGFEYEIDGLDISRDMTFITGLSLAGNAKFKQQSAIKSTSGTPSLAFENVDFESKQIKEGWTEQFTKKNYFSLQVINISGGSLGTVSFKNCNITGYRAVVRAQKETDNIESVTFDGCTINAIGDQSVVTNTKVATIGEITFTNSTMLNIVMLLDLRDTHTDVTISECTTCYAPLSNTNTGKVEYPLFYLNKGGEVTINITKTLVGPAMEYNGKIIPYTAATQGGSVMYNQKDALITVQESYKTDFTYATVAETTYPLDDLSDLNKSEKDMFTNPEEGDFKLKEQLEAGALKWRLE